MVVPRSRGDSSPTSHFIRAHLGFPFCEPGLRLAPSVRPNSSRPAAVNPPAGFLVTTPRRLLRVATTSYCRRQRSCCLQGWGVDALLSWHDSLRLPLLAGSALCVSASAFGFSCSHGALESAVEARFFGLRFVGVICLFMPNSNAHLRQRTWRRRYRPLVWRLRGLLFRSGRCVARFGGPPSQEG